MYHYDKHARVAYDDILWTKESAQQYLDQLMTYSAPLKMITEPESNSYEFLETTTKYNDEQTNVETTCMHKIRPFDGYTSYRIAYGGIGGAADVQQATATGTFLCILDNCSSVVKCCASYYCGDHRTPIRCSNEPTTHSESPTKCRPKQTT